MDDRQTVPLTLTASGPGSRPHIVAYVRTVIEQRTVPNDDTSAERLAHGIVTSILHRLGAGDSVAAGGDDTGEPLGTAYLVLLDDGQLFSGHLSPKIAMNKAEAVQGVIAAAPIVADYRRQEADGG